MEDTGITGSVMSALGKIVNKFETAVLALLLASMTLLTFGQVIARYVFNSGWVPAVEMTSMMFAWLVLFGAPYGIKIGGHLAVDSFVRLFPNVIFRAFCVFAALSGLLFAGIMFFGACGNPFSTGTLCGDGYVGRMYRIGLKTEDLHWPRWAVYSILPISMTLFAYRCIEAAVNIITGKRDAIAASHEAEELVRENTGVIK
ncbi:MAG: TRAP transporter small permease [Beijerinckiaceae bacterium]|nr:TRAP transporter small permease [Beijerinckiaceae bacterium]